MSRLYTINVGTRQSVSDVNKAKRWLAEKTGKKVPGIPCLATQQLRLLFIKFIDPLGKVKRVTLDDSGIIKGKQVFNKQKMGCTPFKLES